jgi:competence ComEA-like helix-hairpin-helix protein
LLLALVPSLALAAFEEVQSDARSLAMGGAWAALDNSASPDQPNPAALAWGGGWGASAGFALPFGMADLATVTSSARAARGKLGLGLALGSLGSFLYRESSFRASAAYRIHQALSAGISLGGYQLAIQGYGSSLAPGVDAGLAGKPLPQLFLGLAARNLNRPKMGDPPQELAQELSAGLAYRPLARATTAVQLQAQQGWPVQWRFGQEFWLYKGLSARAGYSAKPASISGGVGLEWAGYTFGYAVKTHPELGLSHCLTLSFSRFTKPEEPADSILPIPSRKIVLNAAPVSELDLLPGVGRRQAQAIAALRDSLGELAYLDQLLAVKGITRKTLERMAPFVDLGFDPEAPQSGLPLDINLATAEELAGLPGIGPMTATFIVSYRAENGPFKTTEDLMKVKGIGRKTFESIRELVTVGRAE